MDESGQWSGLFSSLFSGVGKGLGGALGNSLTGSGQQATQTPMGGPSNSNADLFNDARFNASGWVVGTGKSSAKGTSTSSNSGMTPTMASGFGIASATPAQGLFGTSISLTAVAVIVALYLVLKK